MWTLTKSRNLFFAATQQPYGARAWVAELERLKAEGHEAPGFAELTQWDPLAPNAHSNCPALDGLVSELKTLVRPQWRARVGAIYAGRAHLEGDSAYSQPGQFGGVVVINFAYTYAIEGAAIAIGDFIDYANWARANHDSGAIDSDLRFNMEQAFMRIRSEGPAGLAASKIFRVSSEEKRQVVARQQRDAELFVIAHELAHHILRDGTSRPDREARALVSQVLEEPRLAIEVDGLSRDQLSEIEADILALLLIAGEYADDASFVTEFQAGSGAAIAQITAALMNGDWSQSETHPSALTRTAVLAKVSAGRLLGRGEMEVSMRQNAVRALGQGISFAAWQSKTPVQPDLRNAGRAGNAVGPWERIMLDFAYANVSLLEPSTERLFQLQS